MSNLLDPNFWFDLTPVRLSATFEIGFFVLFTVIVIIGLVLRMVSKSRQDKFAKLLLRRVASAALTLGLAGLVWLFFSFEEIQIFGARFWFLVWLVILITLTITWMRYWKVKVPRQRFLEQSKAEANKYLPRRR